MRERSWTRVRRPGRARGLEGTGRSGRAGHAGRAEDTGGTGRAGHAGQARELEGGGQSGDSPSRWPPTLAAVVVLALWLLALVGLDSVFLRGQWQVRAMVAVSAMLLVAALVRLLWTHARLTACLAGLVAGVAVLVHQAVESGRAQEWVDHPRELLVATRLLLNEGVAPMRVSGALEDLVLLACLMGAWISVLLVTGMDARLLSGLVPVLVLLVPVAVTSQGVPLPLVWGAAVGIGLLLWVGAPRPGGWAPPVAVGLVLAVSAGVISLLPAAGNRAWNTSAITLGPVSPNVPDVTVALGEDLRRPASAVAFTFTATQPGTPVRFPLAELSDFSGGTWHPTDAFDPGSTSVLDLRLPRGIDTPPELTEEVVRSSATPVMVRITGLVSAWLPLPQGTVLVRELDGQEDSPVDSPEDGGAWEADRWRWVEDTQTARSTTALTTRGDAYSTWSMSLLDSEPLRTVMTSGGMLAGVDDRVATDREDLAPYTALPPGVPDSLTRTAEAVVEGARGRYGAAAALRDWFRSGSFTYDESAPYSPGEDPDDPYATMEAFLSQRQGYCVHFASTFAVMARSLGMPARVAVGYASHSGVGATPVDNRSLHAWPEVFIDGAGWVAFEPTPGGAGPGSEYSAGLSDGEADGQSGAVDPVPAPGDRGEQGERDPGGAGSAGDPGAAAGPGVPGWVPGVGTGMLLLALGVLAVPRIVRTVRGLRRRWSLGHGRRPATAAWAEFQDTVEDLGGFAHLGGGHSPRARTPEALVEALVTAGVLPGGTGIQEPGTGGPGARLLAEAVVTEAFGQREAGSPSSQRSGLRSALAAVRRDLRARRSWRGRMGAVLLPRSAQLHRRWVARWRSGGRV